MIGIDTGGTFTDLIHVGADGAVRMIKAPSTPADPAQSFLRGIAELRDGVTDADIVHGCTVGTNAVLELRGARTALVTTRGMADVIEIGRQARTELYSLNVTRPAPLVPRELRFEVDERVTAEGDVLRAPDNGELDALAGAIIATDAESVAVTSYSFPSCGPSMSGASRKYCDAGCPQTSQSHSQVT